MSVESARTEAPGVAGELRLAAPWLAAPATRRLLAAFGGAPLRFVGGCVRDALLGLPVADLDLATPLAPDVVLARLGAAGLRAIPTGLAHGTVTAVVDGRSFEITTLRRDVATDGRHAVVAFTDDWLVDAARRDFTFNALSCTPEGVVQDPFGGLADLAAGRVRFVGSAAQRIAEDHLRILRYVRFHARFGRGPPDAEAVAACRAGASLVTRLSGERLAREVFGLLAVGAGAGGSGSGGGGAGPGAGVVEGWRLLAGLGVVAVLLPTATAVDRLARLVALEPLVSAELAGVPGGWPLLRLAALLGGGRRRGAGAEDEDGDGGESGTAVRAVAERLRLSAASAEWLRRLLDPRAPLSTVLPVDPLALRRAAVEIGDAGLLVARSLLCVAGGGAEPGPVLTVARAFQAARFPVTGDDLITAGIPPGPELGRRLRALRLWWAESGFTADRDTCLQAILTFDTLPL